MATYKKRGGKPTMKAEKEISIEDESTTASIVSSLDGGASKTEEWVIRNQKYILKYGYFIFYLKLLEMYLHQPIHHYYLDLLQGALPHLGIHEFQKLVFQEQHHNHLPFQTIDREP